MRLKLGQWTELLKVRLIRFLLLSIKIFYLLVLGSILYLPVKIELLRFGTMMKVSVSGLDMDILIPLIE
jgi:hypothetical protein